MCDAGAPETAEPVRVVVGGAPETADPVTLIVDAESGSCP